MPGPITCVSTSQSILGENPLWDGVAGRLLSIDCMGRKLFRLDVETGQEEEWALHRVPGSAVLRSRGGLLMANRQGLAFFDLNKAALDDIATPGIDFSREVFNDGKCDSYGRFWTGTMHREVTEPVGALYRIGTDLQASRMADGITLSNGIAWSPDERVLYHCDSRPGRVWAYDYDIEAGEITNRRVHIDFAQRRGRPDGCTVDAEGGLWVAEIGAGQVVRFDPAGREVLTVALPVSKPTSVTFGGPDLRTLFVTSMRYGLSDEARAEEPLAGGVFAFDAEVGGLPAAAFGG
jgi:sugar lactone lactonase YvrE